MLANCLSRVLGNSLARFLGGKGTYNHVPDLPAYDRDMVKAWDDFFKLCKESKKIKIKEIDTGEIISVICYTTGNVEEGRYEALKKILDDNLNNKKNIMTTIAQVWQNQGREEGIFIGREEGIFIGREEEKQRMAKNLLRQGCNDRFIKAITGLSISEISSLRKD